MTTICEEEVSKLKRLHESSGSGGGAGGGAGGRVGINTAVSSDVSAIFRGKTVSVPTILTTYTIVITSEMLLNF